MASLVTRGQPLALIEAVGISWPLRWLLWPLRWLLIEAVGIHWPLRWLLSPLPWHQLTIGEKSMRKKRVGQSVLARFSTCWSCRWPFRLNSSP